MWDTEAARDVVSRLMVTCHRCRGRPGEGVVEHLSTSCSPLALCNLTTMVSSHWESEWVLGHRVPPPACSEALDRLRVEAEAEGMADHVLGHHPMMPSLGKTT